MYQDFGLFFLDHLPGVPYSYVILQARSYKLYRKESQLIILHYCVISPSDLKEFEELMQLSARLAGASQGSDIHSSLQVKFIK